MKKIMLTFMELDPREIFFFPKLPLGVKFTITSAMIKLLKLKACLNFQILMMQTNTQ